MAGEKILIVDDEKNMCQYLSIMLRKEGYEVKTAHSGKKALQEIRDGNFDVVLTDIKMEGMDGIELLRAVKEQHPTIPVIIMTAYATQKTAIEALNSGAYYYLIKRAKNEEIKMVIRSALDMHKVKTENVYLKKQLKKKEDFKEIIGKSEEIQAVFNLVNKVADTDSTILIGGESGTGKEVLARAIHLSSKRSGGPFTVVDCSSLPATLIESELFGYEPGTFTGAKREGRPGKFELAHGGTLFLDEVGDMPLELQSRLLRILNDHQVMRLGGSRAKRVDIRILASTNKELRAMVAAGTFREDLFHRIMGAEIVLPPLRERMEHFDELVELFVEKHGHGRSYWMEPQAMEAMRAYRWPGNIRELEKCVEYITAMKPGGRVDKADLPENVFHECPDTDGNTFREKMRRYEHQLLMQALARSDYNITRTAKELGLSRRGLQKKMDKAGVGVVKDRRSKKGG